MNIVIKKPIEFEAVELQDFEAFVLAGGEVTPSGLKARIHDAAFLVMLFIDNCLTGIGAIKNPHPSYRLSTAQKASVSLSSGDLPYELGWVFVLPSARGRGLSRSIVEVALDSVNGEGIFATSRTDNMAMHHSLERFGFTRAGHIYKSDRGTHQLQLFIRSRVSG